MPPGRNSVPLEKVLLQMDLSKGLDERSRPEVGGDQSKLITSLENLVQDQAGAWVKRPGLTLLSSVPSTANAIRAIRTQNGLGVIDDAGYFSGYSSASGLIRKNVVPEFKVDGRIVASTQTNTTYRVLANASDSTYDIVVVEGSVTTAGARTAIMVATDRDTGTVVGKWNLGDLCTATGSHTPQVKMAFTGSEILHIWCWANNTLGSPLTFLQVSTGSLFSISSGSGLNLGTPTTIDALNTQPITDINAWSGGSVITYGTTARAMTNGGVSTTRTAGGHSYQSVDIDSTETYFYFLSADFATARARVDQVTVSNIAAAATASFVDASLSLTGTPGIAFDGSKVWVTSEDTSTFCRVRAWSSTMAGASLQLSSTTFGWRLLSTPFRGSNNKIYVHLNKDETGLSAQSPVGCHLVACISDPVTVNVGQSTNTHTVLRVAALLEPYLGYRNTATATYSPGNPLASTTWPRQRYFRGNQSGFSGRISIAVPLQITARSSGAVAYTVYLKDPAAYSSHQFGNTTHIAGGVMSAYDDWQIYESSFFDYPVFTAVDSGVAGNPNGIYNYVGVYKHTDSKGNVHYSRAFGPVSVTVASKKVTITGHACHVTNKEFGVSGDTKTIMELYRTLSGGTQYYLCSTSAVPNTSPQSLLKGASFYAATDDMSDATLSTQPLMWRQPGTLGGALDRYPGPSGHVACQHKDRTFVADPIGHKVYYSSFFVDGEGAWFNAAFSIFVHGGNGPITAMASMDGRLFIFKRDAIFIVDGDGPPENGGSGMEFSPPAKIASEYGCLDQRSLVVTPDGIMYRSARGIEILTRSLQVKWVGERVQNTVSTYPITKSAVLDDSGRVRFILASKVSSAEALTDSPGVEVVYDTSNDCWSTSRYWVKGTYGDVPQTSCVYDLPSSGRQIAMASEDAVYRFNHTVFLDSSNYVPWTIETGWIRPSGVQGRFRFHDAMFLGRRYGNHKLKMSLAYDFNDYSQHRTWEPPSNKENLEEYDLQPNRTQPVSFRLRVQDLQYGSETPDQSVDLLGICFFISPKAGVQQVAESKKG